MQRRQRKANARRKDYIRRRNINNNVPSIEIIERQETFAPDPKAKSHVDSSGRANVIHTGYRYKKVRVKNFKHKDPDNPSYPMKDVHNRSIGMVQYPLRRKFKQSKK